MMDFRQLLNNDDPSNLNRVCNLVFKYRSSDGWSTHDTETIASERRRFNEALDQPADFYSIPDGSSRPTVRSLLDGWFNGEWFHGDEDKRQQRLEHELDPNENLSLALVIPAVRVALTAAIAIDETIIARLDSA